MFIAQIKPPSVTLHPVVGLVHSAQRCGSLANAACRVRRYLKRQARLGGEKPSFPLRTDATKACCIKAGKHLVEITSGAGGLQRKHAQQHWERMSKC